MSSIVLWAPVPGYEGLYSVSNTGLVCSEPRTVPHPVSGHLTLAGRTLSAKPHRRGYPCVTLCAGGVRRQCSVHLLVASAFVANPHALPQVNHKNGDTSDNRAANLEWCTPRENTRHAVRTGLRPRKLSEDARRELVFLALVEGLGFRAIGRVFGIDHKSVSAVVRGPANES